ncbi:2-deoxystreptamine glucosyltransferase [compost metagenome]
MKILQVITSLRTGGAERLMVDSIPVYQTDGIETDLLILKDEEGEFRNKIERNSRNRVSGLTSGSVYNPLLIFRIIPLLNKYDLIHIHLFPTIYWVVLAKIIAGSKTPLVYTEHSTSNKRRGNLLFRLIDKFIYSRVDFIGCISQGTKDELIRHIDRNEQIDVINNGIDLKRFGEHVPSLNFRRLFVNDKSRVLIQVSSFREQKDQRTVIECMRYLAKDISLLLVGDGPLKDEMISFAKDTEVIDRVKFLGNRNDIPELLSISDIAILSSKIEGFGLAIVEGMAAGKPVIASNIIGISEVVKGYGMLFSPGNSLELADIITRLFNDSQLYDEVKSKCISRSKDFSLEKMTHKYINIYKKIIGL